MKLDFGIKICLSVGVRDTSGTCSYCVISNFDAGCGLLSWGGRVGSQFSGRVGNYPRLARSLPDKESLGFLLLDMDTIEGKLPRRNGCDSDKTNHTTTENVLWGHGGLVTGRNKGFPCIAPLQSP
jgi:hypothetical protein